MKIIFLDVDGVLNGYNIFTELLLQIYKFFHCIKFVKYDIFSIKKKYMRRLQFLCRKTKAVVVIHSTWRHGYFKPYESKGNRAKQLEDYMKKYEIDVIDITPKSDSREKEIILWLSLHKKEVEKFIILDDEKFHYDQYFKEGEVILTSRDGNVRGHWKENTGLKWKHVMRAIKILNN